MFNDSTPESSSDARKTFGSPTPEQRAARRILEKRKSHLEVGMDAGRFWAYQVAGDNDLNNLRSHFRSHGNRMADAEIVTLCRSVDGQAPDRNTLPEIASPGTTPELFWDDHDCNWHCNGDLPNHPDFIAGFVIGALDGWDKIEPTLTELKAIHAEV